MEVDVKALPIPGACSLWREELPDGAAGRRWLVARQRWCDAAPVSVRLHDRALPMAGTIASCRDQLMPTYWDANEQHRA
jgi:hypothetical protein